MPSFGNSMIKLFLVLCLAMLVHASDKPNYSCGNHSERGKTGKNVRLVINPCTEAHIADNNGSLKYPLANHPDKYVECFQLNSNTSDYKCGVQLCDGDLLFIDEIKACDINECDTYNGGCQHHCENYEGRYECSCEDGFELDGDKHNCTDIDHCVDNPCGDHGTCDNGPMTHSCTCDSDYYGANCDFTIEPTCGDVGKIQTFANGTTAVSPDDFSPCLISESRGQDDSNYTLSVDLYKPEGYFFVQVLYNFHDTSTTDIIQFSDDCIDLVQYVDEEWFRRGSEQCIPLELAEGWFTLEVVVTSDSDKITIKGNNTLVSDVIALPDPKIPKIAAGGLVGSSLIPLHFGNFRIE